MYIKNILYMKRSGKLNKKAVFIVLSIIFILMVLISAYLYQFMKQPVKILNNYYFINVDEGEIASYDIFINPIGKYEKLLVIDSSLRYMVSNYMKENNLKLSEGEQCFDRVDTTYENLIKRDLKFEKIE